MRRGTWLLMSLGLLVPFTTPAMGGTSVGISVSIGDAPPPPVVVVREEPRLVVVPGSTVYVVSDRRIGYDVFRYGVFWYVYNDGYWYRARSHRGPYRAIGVKYVPRAIMTVPARHWKHHPHGGPPGQMKKQVAHSHHDDVIVVKERGNGRKHKH
jgi:hypothetical protein